MKYHSELTGRSYETIELLIVAEKKYKEKDLEKEIVLKRIHYQEELVLSLWKAYEQELRTMIELKQDGIKKYGLTTKDFYLSQDIFDEIQNEN